MSYSILPGLLTMLNYVHEARLQNKDIQNSSKMTRKKDPNNNYVNK